MRKPVIVRGSHPNDYHGFIDIVPTRRDVYDRMDLQEAVLTIEHAMIKDEIQTHCEDWNQPYTSQVHVLIQEQTSNFVGTMIRHPNDRKQFRIQYLDIEDTGPGRDPISCAILDNLGFRHHSNLGFQDEEMIELMRMYKKLEVSGVLDKEWSQQVEFGLRPLMFFQARPFKKYQQKDEFDIYDSPQRDIPFEKKITSEDCFGITPPEGIDLEFHFVRHYSFNSWNGPDLPLDKPYGLAVTSKSRESIHPGCRIGNVKVYCSPCLPNHYLYHSNYRFMKKADISLISGLHYCSDRSFEEFKESRVFADGERGVVVPRRYL
jgi:hypothetical protein